MASRSFELDGLTWSVLPLEPDEQIEVECILLQVVGPSLGAALASVVQGLAPALVELLRETVNDSNAIERAITEAEARLAAEPDLIPATIRREGEGEAAALVLVFEESETAAEALAMVVAETAGLMEVDLTEEASGQIRLILAPEVLEGQPFEVSRILDIDTSDPRLHIAWERLLDALAVTGGDLVRDAVMALSGRIDHRDILRLFELVILGSKKRNKSTVVWEGRPALVTTHKVLGQVLANSPRPHVAKWHLLAKALRVTYSPPPVDEPEEAEGSGGE